MKMDAKKPKQMKLEPREDEVHRAKSSTTDLFGDLQATIAEFVTAAKEIEQDGIKARDASLVRLFAQRLQSDLTAAKRHYTKGKNTSDS